MGEKGKRTEKRTEESPLAGSQYFGVPCKKNPKKSEESTSARGVSARWPLTVSFWGEDAPTKIDYGKEGCPYSNLSTGGPRCEKEPRDPRIKETSSWRVYLGRSLIPCWNQQEHPLAGSQCFGVPCPPGITLRGNSRFSREANPNSAWLLFGQGKRTTCPFLVPVNHPGPERKNWFVKIGKANCLWCLLAALEHSSQRGPQRI